MVDEQVPGRHGLTDAASVVKIRLTRIGAGLLQRARGEETQYHLPRCSGGSIPRERLDDAHADLGPNTPHNGHEAVEDAPEPPVIVPLDKEDLCLWVGGYELRAKHGGGISSGLACAVELIPVGAGERDAGVGGQAWKGGVGGGVEDAPVGGSVESLGAVVDVLVAEDGESLSDGGRSGAREADRENLHLPPGLGGRVIQGGHLWSGGM